MLIRQVKVWDGPVLLQSITAGSVLEDGLHLYEGLYRLPDADKVPGAPDLRDLNGDGSADLGLLVNCGFPHNVNYAHFLWNEAMGQLVFSGLFLPPGAGGTQAAWWRREHVSNYPDIRRRYTFSRYGVPLLTGVVSRGALPPEESTLPIPEEGVHFTFSSGAGAWSTDLTLFPDGTFSGKFHDRDMDITYLCQFQGVFSMLTPLDSRTWSLTPHGPGGDHRPPGRGRSGRRAASAMWPPPPMGWMVETSFVSTSPRHSCGEYFPALPLLERRLLRAV